MKGLFFTGTDTSAGKTHVAAAVVRLLRQHGHRVGVAKPVATGAQRVNGRWVSEDTVRLAAAAGTNDLEGVTPWAFPAPAAPPVAARWQDTMLYLEDLVAAAKRQQPVGGALVVEGVGGLLCPVTENETVADLAAALELPMVVVARRSLGTLNHTLLTLEVARGRGLPVVGVVVNETEPPDAVAIENVAELRRRLAIPLLAVVPYASEKSAGRPDALAGVDWWRLCHPERIETLGQTGPCP